MFRLTHNFHQLYFQIQQAAVFSKKAILAICPDPLIRLTAAFLQIVVSFAIATKWQLPSFSLYIVKE